MHGYIIRAAEFIGTGLEYQHTVSAARKPIREDATGRSCTDHDHVVFHRFVISARPARCAASL